MTTPADTIERAPAETATNAGRRAHFPEPEGPVVGMISVSVPQDAAGAVLSAGVIRDGVLRAVGRAAIANAGETVDLPLQGMEKGRVLEPGTYEVRLAINRDAFESFYPSFGDEGRVEEWTIESAARRQLLSLPAGEWRRREASAPGNVVTVRYHHPEDEYTDASLWAWDTEKERSPEDQNLHPVGRDDFGLVFQFDRAEYGKDGAAERIGLLPRHARDWDRKEGADRYWREELGREVYLKAGRNVVWTERPNTELQVEAAFLDGPDQVVVELSRGVTPAKARALTLWLADEDSGQKIELTLRSGEIDADDGQWIFLPFTPARPIDDADVLTVRCGELPGVVELLPRNVLDNPDRYASDLSLGAAYASGETMFRAFAPTAQKVEVVLYDNAEGDAGRAVYEMRPASGGVWEATVEGDLEGRFYVYRLTGHRLFPEIEVVDIYATNTVNSGSRARITDLAKTNPPGWETLRNGPRLASPVDAVIWEMHVRDFTISPTSGVSSEDRGKYLGWTRGGTRLPADRSIPTCLDHLVELGVTHVQLMPVQDFENEEARNLFNWGYITNFFNSPEGLYSSDISDESRVRELKALIAALHERGIGVILDVVYNHTGHNASFDKMVPDYYYRLNDDRSYANGSACGNDFRTESPMGRRFIIDSLKFWVEEYGVDGFRFDLMALMDRETMRQVDAELRALKPDILLYGEPWSAGDSPIAGERTDKQGIRGTQIGAFNDGFRNCLKGPPDASAPGFIQTGVFREGVIEGMLGQKLWAPTPGQAINYMTCHDNLVLWDKLEASLVDPSHSGKIELMKLGYFALFTAQGVPFIHGGEEFGRTKFGNHNSYDAPDEINQVDWSLKKTNFALFEYVRDLIALRKSHPLFRLRAHEEIRARVGVITNGWRDTVGFIIDGSGVEGESWKRACVIVNSSWDATAEFALPGGEWVLAFDEDGLVEDRKTAEGKVRVRPKRGAVFYQEGDAPPSP